MHRCPRPRGYCYGDDGRSPPFDHLALLVHAADDPDGSDPRTLDEFTARTRWHQTSPASPSRRQAIAVADALEVALSR